MKRRYENEFKKMIVELYNIGCPAKELGNDYGVSPNSINKWVKESSKMEKSPENILLIEKENERLKKENKILKNTLNLLAKNA